MQPRKGIASLILEIINIILSLFKKINIILSFCGLVNSVGLVTDGGL
jgi:hypothetical protein